MVVLAVAARLVFVLLISPTTDVYYYDTQAAETLLAGASPYAHTFTGIPPRLLTPGAENVFSYLPFTALYMVPFRLLGDVRIGFVLADLLIALTLYQSTEKRRTTIAGVYLFAPFVVVFSTIYINNAIVSMLFLALFFYFEGRGRRLLPPALLGLSLASIQVAWLILPVILYYQSRERKFREIVIELATASLVMLPFALLDFNSFFYETISFQFSRPVLEVITITGPIDLSLGSLLNVNLNLSLNGFLLTLAGFTLPLWSRVAALAVVLPFVLRRVKDLSSATYACGVFLLVTLFVLPSDFFLPYLELPFFIFLAYFTSGSPKP
jgi:uncharacterized membrane protein